MKKIFSIICLFLIVFSFSSCESESTDTEFSLTGKTYAGQTISPSTIFPTGVYTVFRFTTKTDLEYTTRHGSATGEIIGDPEMTTYVLNYPTITIKIPNKYADDGYLTYDGEFVDESCFRVKVRTGYLEFRKQ